MNNSDAMLSTTRIVARALALLSNRLRVIAMALAFTTPLVGANAVQAQCEAWVQGIGTPGTDGFVSALVVLPGGDVIVGGSLTTAGGVPARRIARYNPSTGVWSALNDPNDPNLGPYIDRLVYALAVLPGGDVIVGGNFNFWIAGVNRNANGIARYKPSTGVWSALGAGVSNNSMAGVAALTVLPGGDVVVGGFFDTAGGVLANGIARYNPSTGVWSGFGTGTNGTVSALAVLPGGDVIVGGNFTTAGGVPANNIARYNPSTGVWSGLGAGTSSEVRALAVLPGGDVIAGGTFNTAGGVSALRIARCNPSTGVWSALGAGIDNTVFSLAVLPGGDVLAGGFFTTAGAVWANGIARYNPSTDAWTTLGLPRRNDYCSSLAVLPNGDVLVGGGFTTAGGVPANNIARYFPGIPAPTITTPPVSANVCSHLPATFSITPAGTGPFTYQWRKNTVAINTTVNPSAATATLTLANLQPSDSGSYDCVVSNDCGSVTSIPAWLSVALCPCGLSDIAGPGQATTPDRELTADDIIVFLAYFFIGEQRADVAGPGQSTTPDGQFTADDIILFLNRFFAGC